MTQDKYKKSSHQYFWVYNVSNRHLHCDCRRTEPNCGDHPWQPLRNRVWKRNLCCTLFSFEVSGFCGHIGEDTVSCPYIRLRLLVRKTRDREKLLRPFLVSMFLDYGTLQEQRTDQDDSVVLFILEITEIYVLDPLRSREQE